jgi:hypothetical protein
MFVSTNAALRLWIGIGIATNLRRSEYIFHELLC